MRDIHNYQQALESALKRIESLSLNNQKAIKDFVRNCELEEISTGRIAKYVNHLIKIAEWLNKDFIKADKKDIENLVLKIKEQGYTAWTIKDYKVAIKKFFRFLKKEKITSWIKTTIKDKDKNDIPNEVLTEEEIKQMISKARSSRDKVIINVLFESGCRISELLNIKIKDIAFEQDYAMLNVNGKTGQRKIPISESIPLLKVWLNENSDKDKEDYVFNIPYTTIDSLLKSLAKKCDITKPVNPHAFRHARASILALKLKQAQMELFFGWKHGSNMPQIYYHLNPEDLIQELMVKTKTRKCYDCGFENPVDLKFCSKCLSPLDSKKFKEKSEQEEVMKNMYKLAMQDKEWLDFTSKRLQKLMK